MSGDLKPLTIGQRLDLGCNICGNRVVKIVEMWHNPANDSDWVQIQCVRLRCRKRGNYPYFWPELHGREGWTEEEADQLMGMISRSMKP